MSSVWHVYIMMQADTIIETAGPLAFFSGVAAFFVLSYATVEKSSRARILGSVLLLVAIIATVTAAFFPNSATLSAMIQADAEAPAVASIETVGSYKYIKGRLMLYQTPPAGTELIARPKIEGEK